MVPLLLAFHLLLSLGSPRSEVGKAAGEPVPTRPVASRFPPPPWSFVASRIRYQFRLVRAADAAPTVPHRSPADGGGAAGVNLLSLGGWTLGGLFAVEYESSPVGPYREVAVLSGLVARGVWPIGAWASHIFVDSEDAAEAGREIWGLPASVVPIDFDARLTEYDAVGTAEGGDGDARPEFVFSEGLVSLRGCPTTNGKSDKGNDVISNLEVTLPSYSGRLGASDPLLRYPLTVQSPESISRDDAGQVICRGNVDIILRTMLENSLPLFAVNVGKTCLNAGIPDPIQARQRRR